MPNKLIMQILFDHLFEVDLKIPAMQMIQSTLLLAVTLLQPFVVGAETLVSRPQTDLSATNIPASCDIFLDRMPSKEIDFANEKNAMLERKQQALLVETKAKTKAMPASARKSDMVKLIADIERRQIVAEQGEVQNKKCPMYSKAAKAYIQEIVNRIQDCGTQHFPTEHGEKIYGTAQASFLINRDGTLLDSSIERSSGIEALNQHVMKLIAGTAPFGVVPADIHADRFDRMRLFAPFNFFNDGSDKPSEVPTTRCAFALGNASAQAVVAQMMSHPTFFGKGSAVQRDLADNRARLMTYLDQLKPSAECVGTTTVVQLHRNALAVMLDKLINQATLREHLEVEVSGLNERERSAAFEIYSLPIEASNLPTQTKQIDEKSSLSQTQNRYTQGKLRDYTVDEKAAVLYAAKRALASLAQSIKAGVRASAPQIYQQYKAQSVAALDACLAEQEIRQKK